MEMKNISIVQLCSHVWLFTIQWTTACQSCPILHDPINCRRPGLPVLHHLLKLAQLHDHCISYTIQTSHALMSSSPSALSQSFPHQGLCQKVSCLHQLTEILEPNVTTEKTIAFSIEKFVRKVFAFQNAVNVCHNIPAKKQLSSDFMAVVTICTDFSAQEEEICRCFHFSLYICQEMMGPEHMILVCCCCCCLFVYFLKFSFKPAFSLSSFTLMKRFFDSSSFSAIWCCCSVAQPCPTFCDSMDCNTIGFPVFHHLPEIAQTHVYWVGNVIQPSCPQLSPSFPAF